MSKGTIVKVSGPLVVAAGLSEANMKLDENERSTTIRLMKVKDMLLKQAIEEQKARDASAIKAFEAKS